LCGGRHDVLEHNVARVVIAGQVGDEALHQDAIEAVVAHPAEMARDGLAVAGREKVCGCAADGHARNRTGFTGLELARVRVHVDDDRRAGGSAAARPVAPVGAGRTARGTAKPSLVAEENLVFDSRRVDGLTRHDACYCEQEGCNGGGETTKTDRARKASPPHLELQTKGHSKSPVAALGSDLTICRKGDAGRGGTEIRMIEEVVHLGAELQPHALTDRLPSAHHSVEGNGPRVAKIWFGARSRAERIGPRAGVGIGVKPFIHALTGAEITISLAVRIASEAAHSRERARAGDGDRSTSLESDDATGLPVAQNPARDSVREKVLAVSERELVYVVGDEALRDIRGRDGSRFAQVVRVDVVGSAEKAFVDVVDQLRRGIR